MYSLSLNTWNNIKLMMSGKAVEGATADTIFVPLNKTFEKIKSDGTTVSEQSDLTLNWIINNIDIFTGVTVKSWNADGLTLTTGANSNYYLSVFNTIYSNPNLTTTTQLVGLIKGLGEAQPINPTDLTDAALDGLETKREISFFAKYKTYILIAIALVAIIFMKKKKVI